MGKAVVGNWGLLGFSALGGAFRVLLQYGIPLAVVRGVIDHSWGGRQSLFMMEFFESFAFLGYFAEVVVGHVIDLDQNALGCKYYRRSRAS